MQITQEQYQRIEKYLPVQRGNVSITNLQLINAILYVTENGCKWRALPASYGNWHTIYVRMNRWSKSGVLERVFAALQTEGIIRLRVQVVCPGDEEDGTRPAGPDTPSREESASPGESGEQPQRRFIWLPRLTERLSVNPGRAARETLRRKGQAGASGAPEPRTDE